MKHIHDLTRLIISCWLVSGTDRTIPTSQGLLDRALRIAVDRGVFPEWAREKLHFVDARTGLQCVELSTILDWAQMAELTTVPNPSYQKTMIQVSDVVATHFLSKLEINKEDAQKWGEILRQSMETAKEELSAYDLAGVEDY